MLAPAALPLAFLLLTADPVITPPMPDIPPLDAPQQPIDPQALAVGLGHTIGTAMECAVDANMDADEAKAERLIDQAATDQQQDPMYLEDQFHDAMAEGRDQVLDDEADCDQAKTDLDKFEGQQPDD